MRLKKLERGGVLKRLLFPIMSWKVGARVPDVLRTLLHRPSFFGTAYNDWIETILRGPSKWSVWERELFASFTSSRNQCVF